MGPRCSMCREDEVSVKKAGRLADDARDVAFWQEKMRFSYASQTLFDAAVSGDSTLAADAIRGLGDPNCCNGHGYKPLQVAISCGNFALVEQLLKAGAEVNGHSKMLPPPVVLAAGNGDLRLFDHLLDRGADLNCCDSLIGETALIRASDRGHTPVVMSILSRGSPGYQKMLTHRARLGPEGDGATSLHLAARRGFREICDRLLGCAADPSAADRKGRMPLHAAAEMNQLETASMLLTFGSSTSGADKAGLTPLHVAAGEGFLSMVDLLARFTADVNAQSKDGDVPLHFAAKAGHDVVCQLLISQLAEPNVPDASGRTPFACAFEESRVRCCRVLLESGAEVKAIDSQRWVPPYTEFDPTEHANLAGGKARRDAPESDRDLIGC